MCLKTYATSSLQLTAKLVDESSFPDGFFLNCLWEIHFYRFDPISPFCDINALTWNCDDCLWLLRWKSYLNHISRKLFIAQQRGKQNAFRRLRIIICFLLSSSKPFRILQALISQDSRAEEINLFLIIGRSEMWFIIRRFSGLISSALRCC